MSKTLDPNHPDWQALVRAARDRREDETPRLVLCDFIDDNFTDLYFTSFIRAQCAVARIPPPNALGCMGWEWLSPEFAREHGYQRELLKRTWLHWPFWKEVPESLQHQWRWVMGFPDLVVCEWEWWVKWWATLTAIGPVGEVFFTTRPPVVVEYYNLTDRYGFWVDDQTVLREVGKQEYLVTGQEWRSMTGWGIEAHYNRMVEWSLRQVWNEGDMVTAITVDPDLAMLRVPDEPWRLGAARSP